MRPLNLAACRAGITQSDVALPQAGAIGKFACLFRDLSAIVHVGRTQAAFTSHKGAAQSTPPANKWSRGCRALKSPYLHFAWSASSQLAPKKLKKSSTSTSLLFRPNQPTPASTSNLSGRVTAGSQPQPALFSHLERLLPLLAVGRTFVPFNMEGTTC